MTSLIVEPLICVHDALVAQARAEDDLFARAKLKEWFAGEIEVAGRKLVIPVDGAVAESWDMKWPCPACKKGHATTGLDAGDTLKCGKCGHLWSMKGGEKL